jgi:hypothetical protein
MLNHRHRITDRRPMMCPRCTSPSPTLHPAVQAGGEVTICPDTFHTGTREGRAMLAAAMGGPR